MTVVISQIKLQHFAYTVSLFSLWNLIVEMKKLKDWLTKFDNVYYKVDDSIAEIEVFIVGILYFKR